MNFYLIWTKLLLDYSSLSVIQTPSQCFIKSVFSHSISDPIIHAEFANTNTHENTQMPINNNTDPDSRLWLRLTENSADCVSQCVAVQIPLVWAHAVENVTVFLLNKEFVNEQHNKLN